MVVGVQICVTYEMHLTMRNASDVIGLRLSKAMTQSDGR